jgi:hypothetical protein
MATPLVRMLWNSGMPRLLPVIWQSCPDVRSTKKSITMHPPSIYILYIFIVAGRRPAIRRGYYVKARGFSFSEIKIYRRS